jgi:hypothetical protein
MVAVGLHETLRKYGPSVGKPKGEGRFPRGTCWLVSPEKWPNSSLDLEGRFHRALEIVYE